MVIAIALPELNFRRANNKTIFADVTPKLAGSLANSVDPDQMPPFDI